MAAVQTAALAPGPDHQQQQQRQPRQWVELVVGFITSRFILVERG
jgi:hypothetical protein